MLLKVEFCTSKGATSFSVFSQQFWDLSLIKTVVISSAGLHELSNNTELDQIKSELQYAVQLFSVYWEILKLHSG